MVPKKILRLDLIGLLSLIIFIVSCSGRAESGLSDINAESDKPKDSLAIQLDTARGVQILMSKNGHLSTEISSELMVRKLENSQPSSVNLFGGVHINFFNSQRDTLNQVDAKRGFYDEKNKYVTLQDSIVVRNIKGEILKTNYITWADSSHEFYTDQVVEIVTAKQKITGIGLRAAEDFSTYTIHQVKGIIQVDDAQIPSNQ